MLKGRRSSTPSQKEKEKEKSKAEKGNKKQQRSASTSAIKNNNNNSINNNTNASASFSYSLPNNDKRDISDGNNVDNYTNNNPDNPESSATLGGGQHWSDFVCETVLLVLNDGGVLHFEVLGGADEGRFPYIGPQLTSAEECGVTIQSLSPSGKTSK